MEVLKTLKVKNLNGTFEQITPIGTETEYVSRKWVNPDSGNTEEITLEQSLSLIEQDIDRINGDVKIAGSIDAKINQAKEDLIGEASEVYNTFEKVQNQVEKNIKGEGLVEGDEENLYNTLYKVNNKLNQLDGSVSINGSIKQQISAAINDLKGNASTAMDTLEEIEVLFNSIKSNEEEGLDSLSELASVYTQLKTLIGELPDQYKNSTVIQYIQALVEAEASRAKQQENSLSNIIESVNNICASEIEKIDTKVNNLHGIIATWNGDTTDVEYESDGTNYWYKVSDVVLTQEDLIGKTIQYTYQSSTISHTITSNNLTINGDYIKVDAGSSRVLILCIPTGIYFLNEPTNACYVQKLYKKQYPSYSEFKGATTLFTYTTQANESNSVDMTLYSVGNIMQIRIKGTLDSTIEFKSYTFDPPYEGSMLVPSYHLVKRIILNNGLNATLQITPGGNISIYNFSDSTLGQKIEINETFVLDSQLFL